MVVDNNPIEEYPFDGVFYDSFIDESKPLDEREEEEVIILETKCDIQEANAKVAGGLINATFNVYFPFDKSVGVPVRKGHSFRGNFYGVSVNGRVIGVFPTQIGGCECYITDYDAK